MDVNNDDVDNNVFEELVPLWMLLTDQEPSFGGPFSPAAIVEAIEKQGVNGFDRVGRWKKYTKNTRQVNEAIEAVERLYAHMAAPDFDLHEFSLQLEDTSPLWRYGWPLSNLPPLKHLEKKLKVPSSNHISRNLNNSNLLVGMLTAVILGELDGKRHPSFKSKQALIDRLDETARRYSLDGVRARSLETKLKDGIDRFKEAQLPKKN